MSQVLYALVVLMSQEDGAQYSKVYKTEHGCAGGVQTQISAGALDAWCVPVSVDLTKPN